MSTKNTSEQRVCKKANLIESILTEAGQHGLAFVEDEYMEVADGSEVYNPFVDRENSMMWLKEKLEAVSK